MNSGCIKVQVGCVIVKDNMLLAIGTNRTDLDLCKTSRGCLRIEKYGENSKLHRNPEDCRAIHSEIDAIASSQSSLIGATMYVTRYPCEACARAIVRAGIDTIVYGREQKISDLTRRLLEYNNVNIIHLTDYTEEDVTY
jgi:dCMP deaminase